MAGGWGALEGLVMNHAFWKGRRVFLTGHTGFKGGWLSLWLQQLGCNVSGFSLPAPTQPSLFEVARVAEGMNSSIGDVRDADALRHAMDKAQPEIVFHLAAQPLVRYSYDYPVETYATNVMGTVHFLEAVRTTPSVKAAMNITSDKCYENREWVWGYRESDAMGGYDPYSSSKGCAELVTAAYRNSYFNPAQYAEHGVALASARAGNVIGGGDWALDRLIPDMLRAIERGEAVRIRNPHATRPWQHVLEPLAGYLQLAEKLYQEGSRFAEGWNFGPRDEDTRTVAWIIERLTQTWGEGASWQVDGTPQPHEAHTLKLDCSKAHAQLAWHPRWDIGIALEKIVEWHKAHRQGTDMRQISLAQIAAYEQSTTA